MNIKELYKDPRKIVVTAHRGFSGRYPENTLLAFKKAFEAGADFIEFDLRLTKDDVPIVSHDATLKRVYNEDIKIAFLTFKEVKEKGLMENSGDVESVIPSFREVLDFFTCLKRSERKGLNIQIKETEESLLQQACNMFKEYELYNNAYFTVSTFETAEKIKELDSGIEICILERKREYDDALLIEMKNFGCTFIQPHRRDITIDFVQKIKNIGFLANLYYSNTDGDNKLFISYGMQGILTDYPDILISSVHSLNLM
ncbi:MAG: glycerophosphodiester phosphodiesterase [Spirochaetales bacterium]|nr:glycerophosphodiester phosphodiesterase [Spirochaetales bacterium]